MCAKATFEAVTALKGGSGGSPDYPLGVNGLHNPIKRSKVIAKMKTEKLHIIFCQETHLNHTEHDKLKKILIQKCILFILQKG